MLLGRLVRLSGQLRFPPDRRGISGHLGLQRHGQHLPGTLTNQLIEHRPTDSVGLEGFLDYLEHGRTFPNQRANAGS